MTSRIPSHRRIRTVAAAGAAGLLFFAACEMTPRGGPTPTEPTLDDLVGPTAVDENRIIEVDFSVTEVDFSVTEVDFQTDSPATQLTPDGRTLIARVDANGDTTWVEGQRIRGATILARGEQNPLIFVDGEQVASLDGVDQTTILEVNVIKGPIAIEMHGEEAADGVIQVRTKAAAGDEVRVIDFSTAPEAQGSDRVLHIRGAAVQDANGTVTSHSASVEAPLQSGAVTIRKGEGAGSPIFFVDGARVASIDAIDPSTIDGITVIKDATALERFGPDAVHGAVLVTLKK